MNRMAQEMTVGEMRSGKANRIFSPERMVLEMW